MYSFVNKYGMQDLGVAEEKKKKFRFLALYSRIPENWIILAHTGLQISAARQNIPSDKILLTKSFAIQGLY